MEKGGKFCLDSGNAEGKIGIKTNMYVCHGMGVNQVTSLDTVLWVICERLLSLLTTITTSATIITTIITYHCHQKLFSYYSYNEGLRIYKAR